MDRIAEIYAEATKLMPGGGSRGGAVHRVFGYPFYMDHADGSKMYTVNGDAYIDYYCCAGAAMFGHNNPNIKRGLERAIANGFFMNFDSDVTLEFAKLFTNLIPTVEEIRLTNSGTEATLAAIRAARAYTGRDLIVKMDCHFHGMHEMIWYFPSEDGFDEYGEAKTVVAGSAGVPEELKNLVKIIRFNDIHAVEHVVEKYKDRIAAIIMEPVSYGCGCVPGKPEYMKQLREICTQEGIMLIYDEVISGLRFLPGSAQTYYNVQPDLSTFAKAIGGGLSIALVGGKREVMNMFNPVGPVVVSGTSTGNQLAVCGAVECLKMASAPGFFEEIERKADKLYSGMNDIMAKNGIKGHVRGMGAQFGIFFGIEDPEDDYYMVEKVMPYYDADINDRFIAECMKRGLYMHSLGKANHPNHCGFSSVHTDEDIEASLQIMDDAFKALK